MQDLKEIEQAMPMVVCSPGKIFYRPNETGEVIFLLKKGRVHLYRLSSEGRKILIADVGPGSVFGEMVLTGHGMYDAYAEAVEESLLCVMSRRDAGKFILSRPNVALRLLRVMGNRLRELEDRLELTAFSTIEKRVAAVLLALQADRGSDVLSITHQELADYLGVHRETITAALSRLKQEGMVDTRRSRVEITNVEALRKKAFE